MRAVMMSVKPEWCELIRSGEKILEVRKNKPTLQEPYRVYLYESAPRQAVIGEFMCGRVWTLSEQNQTWHERLLRWACMTEEELLEYAGEQETVYGWQISELTLYDSPLPVTAFRTPLDLSPAEAGVPLSGPPQSWRYVEWEPTAGEAGVMPRRREVPDDPE